MTCLVCIDRRCVLNYTTLYIVPDQALLIYSSIRSGIQIRFFSYVRISPCRRYLLSSFHPLSSFLTVPIPTYSHGLVWSALVCSGQSSPAEASPLKPCLAPIDQAIHPYRIVSYTPPHLASPRLKTSPHLPWPQHQFDLIWFRGTPNSNHIISIFLFFPFLFSVSGGVGSSKAEAL